MGFFNEYPYTDMHELNADWILKEVGELHKRVDDFSPEMQEYVNKWLEEHPEATTTVLDNSITFNKLTNELKTYVIPSFDISTMTINDIIDVINSYNIVRLSGTTTIDLPIIIEHPITILCDNVEIIQRVWGNPGIIILSSNVNIYGNIKIVNDVINRTAITRGYYNIVDAKANSSGILIGNGTANEYSNISIESVFVYNFIAGVTSISKTIDNFNIRYLYIENVDFGLFGAGYINTIIDYVKFKDIASYINSVDPSHAIYLTGGDETDLSKNVVINYIEGNGCKSKYTDAVISVKSTKDFKCLGGSVQNVAALASVLNSTGYIENITANNCSQGISSQLANTNFTFRNLILNNISKDTASYINYFTTKSTVILDACEFNVIDNIEEYTAYNYISDSSYTEHNCKWNGSASNSVCWLFANDPTAVIDNPLLNIKTYDVSGSGVSNVKFNINPSKLNYPKTNNLPMPGLTFIPNGYIPDEVTSVDEPHGFKTNDKLRVSNGVITVFNTNNATDGNIYTLYNGGNTAITNGDRIKTKSGQNYNVNDWKVFRFTMIGNVAYEI